MDIELISNLIVEMGTEEDGGIYMREIERH